MQYSLDIFDKFVSPIGDHVENIEYQVSQLLKVGYAIVKFNKYLANSRCLELLC